MVAKQSRGNCHINFNHNGTPDKKYVPLFLTNFKDFFSLISKLYCHTCLQKNFENSIQKFLSLASMIKLAFWQFQICYMHYTYINKKIAFYFQLLACSYYFLSTWITHILKLRLLLALWVNSILSFSRNMCLYIVKMTYSNNDDKKMKFI